MYKDLNLFIDELLNSYRGLILANPTFSESLSEKSRVMSNVFFHCTPPKRKRSITLHEIKPYPVYFCNRKSSALLLRNNHQALADKRREWSGIEIWHVRLLVREKSLGIRQYWKNPDVFWSEF